MALIGGVVGYYVSAGSDTDGGFVMRSGSGTGLTNPLLECDVGADSISSRKEDFSPELESFVDTLKTSTEVSDVAVYYRDLNNGPITSVNAGTFFAPASLLKIPIMMSYLSAAEDDPTILSREITFDTPSNLLPDKQNMPPEQQIVLGTTYTAMDLIGFMIKYSDNQAMALLYQNLPIEKQKDLYTLVGVNPSVLTDPSQQLTVRQYSIFFRILFNASFLSRRHSEDALKLLTQTTFNDGLVAGVPHGVAVAHKFGERKFNDSLQQVHDCGIVYYPKHPYLLCVMTRGEDSKVLSSAIAQVSRFVYNRIDAEYK